MPAQLRRVMPESIRSPKAPASPAHGEGNREEIVRRIFGQARAERHAEKGIAAELLKEEGVSFNEEGFLVDRSLLWDDFQKEKLK